MKAALPEYLNQRLFEATPGINVLLCPQAKAYTIIAVSEDFLRLSALKKENIIGRDYLDHVVRKDSGDHTNTCIHTLRASFESVTKYKRPHQVRLDSKSFWRSPDAADCFWNISNIPLCDDLGNVTYIIHSVAEAPAGQKINEEANSMTGIERAYRFFMQAPVIIGYVRGENYVIDLANEELLKVWKRTRQVIGNRLFEEFPELEAQGVRNLLDEVRRTGKPFFAYEYPMTFVVNGREETLYFDFVYHPYYEHEGDKVAAGVISVGHDVTEKIRAKQKFRNVIEQATNPILILRGEDMIIDAANEALLRVWNVDESAFGKSILDIRPALKEQGFMDLLLEVYRTGKPYRGFGTPVMIQEPDGEARSVYFNFTYQPFREANGQIVGVIVMASDATEQVLAKKQLEESQRKWRELANTMPTIVWTSDANGNVNFFNQRWYEFTGLTESESLGFGWTRALHPDDVGPCLKTWEDSRQKQVMYEIEVRQKNMAGEYRWIIARGVPIRENDIVVAWYGTSTDINERKQLELHLEQKIRERTQELASKNVLLDNILKNSSNGISVSEMIYDDAGNVVDAITILANDAAVNFAGLPRHIYLTKRATELDPHIMRSPYGMACLKTLRTGEPSIMQYFLEFNSRWLELTVSRMDDSHLIHIFTDVTPIKKAQLELERSLEELKFANRNLGEFAYAASHDLKEPMRKIQYFADRLREGMATRLEEGEIKLFDRLQISAKRMEKLIDDLLEYSHAAKGASLNEKIDLNAIVKSVLEDLELEIQKKHATTSVETLPVLAGNARQMQQLFQNLISNALKYSNPNVRPEVRVSYRRLSGREALQQFNLEESEKQFHLIEVSDNGIGFDPQDAEKMFDLFTRLHNDPEYRGSGIGLAIVKKVVESHHGFIRANSEKGKGSTFMIFLPVTEELPGPEIAQRSDGLRSDATSGS